MPRRKARSAPTASAGEPPIIDPHTVYTASQLRAALGLRPNTIRREVASGRLRVRRRAGRYFFLGQFVLEWLQSGEVMRPRKSQEG
jgi:hypothetical protein